MSEELEKMQYCCNCGAELGKYRHIVGDIECCQEPRCAREMRDQYRAMVDEAQVRAEEDGYGLYGGPGF